MGYPVQYYNSDLVKIHLQQSQFPASYTDPYGETLHAAKLGTTIAAVPGTLSGHVSASATTAATAEVTAAATTATTAAVVATTVTTTATTTAVVATTVQQLQW